MKFFQDRIILLSLSAFLLLVLVFTFGPSLHPFSCNDLQMDKFNTSPNNQHWFGTDDLGRDIFCRVCIAGRTSLLIGFIGCTVDFIIGSSLGTLAGFSSKTINEVLTRFFDLMSSIPSFLVTILLVCLLGNTIFSIVIAISFTIWIYTARVVRAQVISLRKKEFILATKVLGASKIYIFFKHLLPNCLPVIIPSVIFAFTAAVIEELIISFLQLGLQPPDVSLGMMIHEGAGSMIYYPWRIAFPILAVTSIVVSANFLTAGIKKYLDPYKSLL